MKRPSIFWRYYLQRRKRIRTDWQPHITDDVCDNGCLTLAEDETAEEIAELLAEEAVEFNYDTIFELGDMPVLKYNDDFVAWRDSEIEAMDSLIDARICVFPWTVLQSHHFDEYVKSNTLYYSQYNLGSCMGHADAFAHHSGVLTAIGRGVSLEYNPFNAVYTWAWSKNGSMIGGQTVSSMAAAANKLGHYPIALVGSDNLNYNAAKQRQYELEANKYQSAIMFLPGSGATLAEQIMLSCHAGLSVAVGNSRAVSGSTADKNGVKVATLSGNWSHATHFTSYRKVNGTEYVGWVNSHGARYKSSDEGEPADMCWMDTPRVIDFAQSMSLYGQPYIVIPESTWKRNTSIQPVNRVPYPQNFRF